MCSCINYFFSLNKFKGQKKFETHQGAKMSHKKCGNKSFRESRIKNCFYCNSIGSTCHQTAGINSGIKKEQ